MTTLESGRTRRAWRLSSLLFPEKDTDSSLCGVDALGTLSVSRRGGRGFAVPEFSRACLLRLVDYPEMPLRASAREIVKAGRTALIVRTELPIGQEMVAAAYKRVTRKTWWKRLTSLFRTNHCLRTFRLGLELLRRGIPTARPLAVILPPRFHILKDTYVATEWIAGAMDLHHYLRGVESLDSAVQRMRVTDAAEAIGDVLGRMHAGGVSHRDLKVANLLVRQEFRGAEAFVIDLDGAMLRSSLSWKLRIRNLTRLAACFSNYAALTRTRILRGLKTYLARQHEPFAWKDVWRAIECGVRSRKTAAGALR